MITGFRALLAVIIIVALVYTALSVWPVLTSTRARTARRQPAAHPAPTATAPQANPGLPPAGAPGQGQGAGANTLAGSSVTAQNPQSARAGGITPGSTNPPVTLPGEGWATADPASLDPDSKRWLYSQEPVVLRATPDGRAIVPTSLTKEELVILGGTRLWPVETEGEWVMVRSPSHTMGWVHRKKLSSTPVID